LVDRAKRRELRFGGAVGANPAPSPLAKTANATNANPQ
jgi:hypothetical protein